jgi:hypothetical protein
LGELNISKRFLSSIQNGSNTFQTVLTIKCTMLTPCTRGTTRLALGNDLLERSQVA